MGKNSNELNQDITQIIWIGTRQQLAKVGAAELTLPLAMVRFYTTMSDLGFMGDSQLNMSNHVAYVCLFQLWQIRRIRSLLTLDAVEMLVHAFIRSRLDYCNSLFSKTPLFI